VLRGSLNRRMFTTGALASLAMATGIERSAAQEATPSTDRPTGTEIPDPIALGMMVEVVEDRTRLDATIEMIGRELAIVMFHTHWGANSGAFDASLLEYIDAAGGVPLVTWEAWRPLYAGGVPVADQPVFALQSLISGEFDAYIESWAFGLAAYGKPVMLRFGHEMNGDWYPWAVGVNGNSAEGFVTAWRYIHDVFEAAGASNVAWVWSPIAGAPTPDRAVNLEIEDVYPGDEYVDWVGMSGFNFGTTQQPWGVGGWQTFSQIFFASYTRISGFTDKPIIIAETASTEEGGDKAAWITDAFSTELPERFPAIRAVVWFNIIKETDWRVDSSPESLRAFVVQASSPYLQGTVELE
jgi:Glycosyl hydrolase family 26